MNRSITLTLSGMCASTILLTGAADAGQLPGTLNFENQTASRINQTVPENTGNNIKEVEYGDFDNDGDLDVAMAIAGGTFGLRLNKLYRNDIGVFNEVSGAPIIPGFSTLDLSRHVFFRDYDGDGWQDLLIVNDDLSGGGPIKYYINVHPGGVFSHFQYDSNRGVHEEASCGGFSADFDQDGDDDIYSGNYPGPSQDTLYRNDGTGHFTVITTTHVPVDSDYTIDVASADMNGDGTLDLLVTNQFDSSFIYYNNLQNQADQGVGDYKYGIDGNGGRQLLGTPSVGAMEPGDFNNDGRVDIYWSNKNSNTHDRILVNTGNNAAGMAIWVEQDPMPYLTTTVSKKISAADLNADGRVDLYVSTVDRPGILRNTSVNGVVSFVDWTPASAFPSGSLYDGSHAGLFDTNGDGDLDILVGGNNNDFLFEQVPSTELNESSLGPNGGALPFLLNQPPVAVLGSAAAGQTDVYTMSGIGGSSTLSVVLNGPDDYLLELVDASQNVLVSSDRGGLGIEEAFQRAMTVSGDYALRVTVIECAAPAADIDADCDVDFDDFNELLASWGPAKGSPADLDNDGDVDFDDFTLLLANWGDIENEYILEVLSRIG